MTDPIDTARQEGIALGLAMAKAAPRYSIDDDGCMWKRADGEWIDPADIPEPPIPPHVAAARVLLDDLRLAMASDAAKGWSEANRRWIDAVTTATWRAGAFGHFRAAMSPR